MAALAAAVRPFAGGVLPRRAAPAPSDASERAPGKKRPRVGIAPSRDASACLTKNRNSVMTAAGAMSSQELLQKRLACEHDALRGLLQKAELVSRGGGACKAGAPAAGKKERFLASNQRAKPIEEDSNAPSSVKRRKISTPVLQKQKQSKNDKVAEKIKDAKLAEKSKDGKVAEESKDDKVDKVAEESKDDKVTEESRDDKVAEESKGKQEEEYADISIGLSCISYTGGKLSSGSSGDPSTKVVQQSTKARKVQDVQQRGAPKAVDMRGLLYRANLRRQQLEMERAALPVPDQSIDPRELQRLAVLASRSVAIRASCASSGSVLKVNT